MQDTHSRNAGNTRSNVYFFLSRALGSACQETGLITGNHSSAECLKSCFNDKQKKKPFLWLKTPTQLNCVDAGVLFVRSFVIKTLLIECFGMPVWFQSAILPTVMCNESIFYLLCKCKHDPGHRNDSVEYRVSNISLLNFAHEYYFRIAT